MDIKKLKLEKKIKITNQVKQTLSLEVEKVEHIKDNALLVKTKINEKDVYYKIVISEIMKNVDDWKDQANEYNEKKKG